MSVWTEWAAVTRFMESARMAFARERNLWHSLEIADRSEVMVSTSTGLGTYAVSLDDHIQTVEDESLLFGSVLIHSYALTEAAAARFLAVNSRDLNGIEVWGERLLGTRGLSWATSEVLDGLAGAVEVAVVRNAFAHGTRLIDGKGANRLRDAGSPSRSEGDRVALSYDEVRRYRDRLRSLLRISLVDAATPSATVES